MSETMAPDRVEAVIISGPNRGRIVEISDPSNNHFSEEDLRLLNGALDVLIASLDRFGEQLDKTAHNLENRRSNPGRGEQ